MRDELPPVGQDLQRQRLAIIRIVDPHQTRMDRKARRLDYADNLPDIGIRGTRLDEALPNSDRHAKPPNALRRAIMTGWNYVKVNSRSFAGNVVQSFSISSSESAESGRFPSSPPDQSSSSAASFSAEPMEPWTFSLPVAKASVGLSAPSSILSKLSRVMRMVQTASPSSRDKVAGIREASRRKRPSLPKSNLATALNARNWASRPRILASI